MRHCWPLHLSESTSSESGSRCRHVSGRGGMLVSAAGDVVHQFDVRELNVAANASKRRVAIATIIAIAFLDLLSAAFALIDWQAILSHGPNYVWKLGFDAVLWVGAAAVSYVGMGVVLQSGPSADYIRVDGSGIEFQYPAGVIHKVLWGDRELQLKVLDWPRLPSQRFAMMDRRVPTRVSEEAHALVLTYAGKLGLKTKKSTIRFWLNSSIEPRVITIMQEAGQ
jgi:hypothetical protein